MLRFYIFLTENEIDGLAFSPLSNVTDLNAFFCCICHTIPRIREDHWKMLMRHSSTAGPFLSDWRTNLHYIAELLLHAL